MKVLALYTLLLWHAVALAQSDHADTLALRMQALEAVLKKENTIVQEDDYDSTGINQQLAAVLIGVLEVPGLTDAAMDSLLADRYFGMARSEDGKLRILSWDEKTGGSFRSETHVIFYRDAKGIGHAVASGEAGALLGGLGAGYSEIHLLRKDGDGVLYVCIGFTVGCSSCCSDIITVLELTPGSINFDYPAFVHGTGEEDASDAQESFKASMAMDMRCGSGLEFKYDAVRRTFTYAYLTDDLTAVRVDEDEKPRKVSGTIRFDGERFVVE